MADVPNYTFRLNLSQDELMRVYQGSAARVSVVTEQGLRVELSAQHLRRFVSYSGVQGRFRLKTDDNHRFIDLERIG